MKPYAYILSKILSCPFIYSVRCTFVRTGNNFRSWKVYRSLRFKMSQTCFIITTGNHQSAGVLSKCSRSKLSGELIVFLEPWKLEPLLWAPKKEFKTLFSTNYHSSKFTKITRLRIFVPCNASEQILILSPISFPIVKLWLQISSETKKLWEANQYPAQTKHKNLWRQS